MGDEGEVVGMDDDGWREMLMQAGAWLLLEGGFHPG